MPNLKSRIHIESQILSHLQRQPASKCFYSEAENQHFCHAGTTRCTNSREIWHGQGARGSTGYNNNNNNDNNNNKHFKCSLTNVITARAAT